MQLSGMQRVKTKSAIEIAFNFIATFSGVITLKAFVPGHVISNNVAF